MNTQFVQHFLIDLKFNNNRNWFEENKSRYKEAKTEFDNFIEALMEEIKTFDDALNIESAKKATFRIYRDVRFSKNKEPYKTHFGAFIARDGRKSPYAGYYIHFEPDSHFIGGGIYQPEAKLLKAIRTNIFENAQPFKSIISNKDFKKNFTLIESDKLKTAPKGFPKDFADIGLLNYKHYAVSHELSNEFWEQKNTLKKISKIFQMQYPLNAFLNEIVEENL